MTTMAGDIFTTAPQTDAVRRLEDVVQAGILAARADGRLVPDKAKAALDRLNKVRFEETCLRRGKGALCPADARRLTEVLKRLAKEYQVRGVC